MQEKPIVFLGCRDGLLPLAIYQTEDVRSLSKPSGKGNLLALSELKTGKVLWMRPHSLSVGHGHQSFYFDHYIRRDRIYRCMLAFGKAFDLLAGNRLPYEDNLVNLAVVEGTSPVPRKEIVWPFGAILHQTALRAIQPTSPSQPRRGDHIRWTPVVARRSRPHLALLPLALFPRSGSRKSVSCPRS